MDEAEARDWIDRQDVPRGTSSLLGRFVDLLRTEGQSQNLIAQSTFGEIWTRHIVDSLQLLNLASDGDWIDIGTGAGFPGLMVAIASTRQVTLVEPRARRVAFLRHVIDALGLASRVEVHASAARAVAAERCYPIISARAVASLPELLAAAFHLSGPNTTWLLPKGRKGAEELAEARATWQGEFSLVPSITDPQATIVVARNVRPRNRR